MTAKPAAEIRVWSPPGPPSRGVTVTVACPTRTPRLFHVLRSREPAGRSVEVEMLVTLAAIRHRDSCRACDLDGVHAKGANHLRAHLERIVRGAVERAVGATARHRHPDARRN